MTAAFSLKYPVTKNEKNYLAMPFLIRLGQWNIFSWKELNSQLLVWYVFKYFSIPCYLWCVRQLPVESDNGGATGMSYHEYEYKYFIAFGT